MTTPYEKIKIGKHEPTVYHNQCREISAMKPRLSPLMIGLLLAVACAACLPATAVADDNRGLRSAGGEAQFRVIQRFPDQEAPRVELPGVDEADLFRPVVDAVEAEDWQTAFDLLDEERRGALQDRPAKLFLAGRIALEVDEHEQALEWFEAIGDELPLVSDYIAHGAAQAALELDDAHRATLFAAAVSSDSRLYADALFLLARALRDTGEDADTERAAEVLELYLGRYHSRNDAPRVRLLRGEILEDLGRHDDAARAYLELRDRHPLRGEATTAVQRLELLRDELSDDIARRIDADSATRTLNRYVGLYNAHRSDQVINGLPDHLDDFSRGSRERCQAIFKIAHSYTKLRRHSDGTPWYDQVIDQCQGTSFHIRALYLGGRGRWNAGDRPGAMEIFEKIWTDYPDHSFADDAMYFTGRILRSEDRHEEARQILTQQVERYPTGDMAKDAHWLLVRRLFDQEDYDGIVAYVDGLDSTGEDDLYTRGRLHYFRGRALEMNGDDNAAREAFEEVARQVPMSYYALLAINRLARLADTDSGDACAGAQELCDELLPRSREAQPIAIPSRLSGDDTFQRGALLLSLGLTGDARGEFTALRSRHASDHDALWALASLLDASGAYPISHNIARRHIQGWMDDYPAQATRARWQVAYPIPFEEEVNRWARARELPAA